METFEVRVYLKKSSLAIRYDALAAYQKGGFYCILRQGDGQYTQVVKYPMKDIFRVEEQFTHVSWKSTS